MVSIEDTHLAFGVDNRSEPDGVILETDIILDIPGFSFFKGKLDL